MPGSIVTSAYTNPSSPLRFSSLASSAFNVGNQTINLGVVHNFTTGDFIWFEVNIVNHATGLTVGGHYFVIVVDTTTIKLATTYSNATSGISLTFSTPNTAGSYNFRKYYAPLSRTSLRTITFYPCYAKSNIIFNSNIPVQIDISIPGYQSVYSSYPEIPVDNLVQLCGLRALSGGGSWYFGIAHSAFTIIQICSGSTVSDSGTSLPTAPTVGWKQRYIITPSRQIQFWAGLTTPTLIHTSVALNANTDLVLEYGANFNNLAITDCTIKYL